MPTTSPPPAPGLAVHPDPLVRRLAALTTKDLYDMQDRGVLGDFTHLLQRATIDLLTKANARLRDELAACREG